MIRAIKTRASFSKLSIGLRGVSIVLVALIAFASCLARADKLDRLVIAGPYAAVSFPLIHMVETGALADVAGQVEFVAWRDPDQLRAIVLEGRADIVAAPTNVAANLYNRGVGLRLLNVSTWGILWMVSRDASLKTLLDFKGKEIAMPFRGDMPDILFSLVAAKQGLEPKRDFRLRYVASPLDAMQLLILRRVDHALLAEPAISMALRKTKSFPVSLIAPELSRSVNIQAEWGRVFAREARIPQAGIAAMPRIKGNAGVLERFTAAHAQSLRACQADPAACGKMVARRIDMLTPGAVADAIAASPLQDVGASDARPELEFFFGKLHEANPALIGGKLPDEQFYWQAARNGPKPAP